MNVYVGMEVYLRVFYTSELHCSEWSVLDAATLPFPGKETPVHAQCVEQNENEDIFM